MWMYKDIDECHRSLVRSSGVDVRRRGLDLACALTLKPVDDPRPALFVVPTKNNRIRLSHTCGRAHRRNGKVLGHGRVHRPERVRADGEELTEERDGSVEVEPVEMFVQTRSGVAIVITDAEVWQIDTYMSSWSREIAPAARRTRSALVSSTLILVSLAFRMSCSATNTERCSLRMRSRSCCTGDAIFSRRIFVQVAVPGEAGMVREWTEPEELSPVLCLCVESHAGHNGNSLFHCCVRSL
jgi:hypothetical protein